MDKSKQMRTSILELSHEKVRKFFLKSESYCNFNLPPYFNFDSLLNELDNFLKGKDITSVSKKGMKPKNYDDINYVITSNKDGKYAWRPLSLIHPVFYVLIVHKITSKNEWNFIKKRFQEFYKSEKIKCLSIPVESNTKRSDKAEQVLEWWEEVEQQSISELLDYSHMVQTDISDCYGSIYTHAVPWALHDKENIKINLAQGIKDKKLLGNIIDSYISDFSYGQTNGIPQGSKLMDFIAEIVLGYCDMILSNKLSEIDDYKILRYRDDYRIFVNRIEDGEKILRELSCILMDVGFKLNPNKTSFSNDIIGSSIKPDKISLLQRQNHKISYFGKIPVYATHVNSGESTILNIEKESMQKLLLQLHAHSKSFPNCGSLDKSLSELLKKLENENIEDCPSDVVQLVAILVDIAYHNPRTYSVSVAIIAKLVSLIDDSEEKETLIRKIITKFKTLPHNEILLIWLQRITLKIQSGISYEGEGSKLCDLVTNNEISIWNLQWINDDLVAIVKNNSIVDYSSISNLPDVPLSNEVNLFSYK